MSEPYPVTVVDDVFRFTTDHILHYSARFLEMPLPADFQLAGLVFDFSFFPENTAGPADGRIIATLLHLVQRFFDTYPENVLLFICESGDGRQYFRQRLFTKWRLAHDRAAEFQQLPIAIIAGEPAIVGGLLFRQDHPLRTEIATFLEAEIQLYTDAKSE
ncbi:MAG: DUF6169 family protein [Janthinobacterium lividum]